MNILTFDIEEWFHILDHNSTKSEASWSKKEVRIHESVDRILDLLEKYDHSATFFCLGWIAEKYPEVIKKITSKGYDIGTHSHLHQLAYEQTKREYRYDLEKSIKTLEDLINYKITSYRCPGFSITENNIWALDILADCGIQQDSSIFPAGRNHGGISSFPEAHPLRIETSSGKIIKEFPINTVSILNKKFIFSGGGYFRLTPYRFINKWTKSSDYVMTYFHPRDFDPGQPRIKDLSLARKFKSYTGIKKALKKLDLYLSNHQFCSLNEASLNIEWSKTELININSISVQNKSYLK